MIMTFGFLLTCVNFLMSLQEVLLNETHVTLSALKRLFSYVGFFCLKKKMIVKKNKQTRLLFNTFSGCASVCVTCMNEDVSL